MLISLLRQSFASIFHHQTIRMSSYQLFRFNVANTFDNQGVAVECIWRLNLYLVIPNWAGDRVTIDVGSTFQFFETNFGHLKFALKRSTHIPTNLYIWPSHHIRTNDTFRFPIACLGCWIQPTIGCLSMTRISRSLFHGKITGNIEAGPRWHVVTFKVIS